MVENILIGSNKDSKYVAFGDDSQFRDNLVYGFVIIERGKISFAEQKIIELKDFYKIPREFVLHCRILFNDMARAKAGIEHISRENFLSR